MEQETLAATLGLSTTPVREALRRLEAEQLLSLQAHRVVRVAPVSFEEFQQLNAVREALEPIAVALAAQMATEEDMEVAKKLLEVEEAAIHQATPAADLHISKALHRCIYAASGNRIMTQVLDSLWDRCGRYRIIFARADSSSACVALEHRAIIEAFCGREAEALQELIQHHLDAAMEQITRTVESSRVPELEHSGDPMKTLTLARS